MKKIPSREREEEMNSSMQAKQPSSAATDDADSDDAMAGLQADLDRFRDLALRSQADFENYKKTRCPRKRGRGEIRQQLVAPAFGLNSRQF